MIFIGIAVYVLASFFVAAAIKTDKEDIEWTIALAITFGWPVAIPFASIYKLYENVKEIRLERRLARQRQMIGYLQMMRKLNLISSRTQLLITRRLNKI